MQTRRVNVRGIIYHNEKLLVTKFRTKDGGETHYWGTFGGGLDIGEPIEQGLHREMIEETGIAPKIGRLLFMQQFHDGEKEQFELFFHIENPEDYLEVNLETTTHGALELARAEFVSPSEHVIWPVFLSTVDLNAYTTQSLPVYFHNELPKVTA